MPRQPADLGYQYALRLSYGIRQTGDLINFYRQDKKYPMLGSYLYVPVIAGYYGGSLAAGVFSSPDDFINAYALSGDESLFGRDFLCWC